MPFKSEAQRKYMFAKHPSIAQKWAKEGKANVAGKPAKKKSAPGKKSALPVLPAKKGKGGGLKKVAEKAGGYAAAKKASPKRVAVKRKK